ncbi:MAG: hypothetical protein FWF10_11195 [Clostridiales bacterium]|nr:hypothetical protein [Clostridiales bacterium]
MHNNRCRGHCPHHCGDIDRQVIECGADQHVIKHERIVKHRHDIIDDFDIIHEHVFNHFDRVQEREVNCHSDHRKFQPHFCKEDCDCK